MSDRYYYQSGYWCNGCNKEICSSTCSSCGNEFIATRFEDSTDMATIRKKFVAIPRVWHDPSTWDGGRWVVDGRGKLPKDV